MEDKRNTKFSYFSDMSWFDGIGTDIPFNDSFGNSLGEKWESNFPTRSDISDIDSNSNIIPMFGDSFMFSHGVKRDVAIDVQLKNHLTDTSVINFGVPGSSNVNTIKLINQWLNTKYAEKTSCIVVNVAPLPRYDFIFTRNYHKHGVRTKHGTIPTIYDETYANRTTVASMNGGNKPDFVKFEDYENKIVNEIYNHFFEYLDTPVNNIVSFEHYVTQLKWISKAIDKDIYFIMNDWIITNFLNNDDIAWINSKLTEVQSASRLKRVDLSKMHDEHTHEEIYLPCGHWNEFGIKYIANAIYKKITE